MNASTGPLFAPQITLLSEKEEGRQQDNEESNFNPARASGQLSWTRLRRGCRCRCRWVWILVAAGAVLSGVSLGGAAEVAVAEVLAAQVVDAGQLLQLVKELLPAAVLPVATLTLGACNTNVEQHVGNSEIVMFQWMNGEIRDFTFWDIFFSLFGSHARKWPTKNQLTTASVIWEQWQLKVRGKISC